MSTMVPWRNNADHRPQRNHHQRWNAGRDDDRMKAAISAANVRAIWMEWL